MVRSNFSNYFWVSNVSKRDVGLADLGLVIPARKTVNLLDKRHYYLTKDQLIASATSGSLFKKQNLVKVRKVPPYFEPRPKLEIAENAVVPSRRRSAVQVEEIYHEELEISDDAFAEQAADLIDTYVKK